MSGSNLTAFSGDAGNSSSPYDWVFDPVNEFLSTDAGRQVTVYGGRGPVPDGTYTIGNVGANFNTGAQGAHTIVTLNPVPATYQVPGTGGGLWVYGPATSIPAATSGVMLADPVLTVGVSRNVTVSFNGTFTGTVTPSISGAAGTFSPASQSVTGVTSATFALTATAPGAQNTDGMGAASLSATAPGTPVAGAGRPAPRSPRPRGCPRQRA